MGPEGPSALRQSVKPNMVLQSDAIGPPLGSTAEYLTIARLSTGVRLQE